VTRESGVGSSIFFEVHGTCAAIRPAPEVLLGELLVERSRFSSDARGGLRRDVRPERLFELDEGGALLVPSGLVPRLVAAASRAGYEVEVRDLTEPLITASPAGLPDLADDRRRLATALAGSRRGVVHYRTADERLATIKLALGLFPTGRLMVVTTTRGEARKIARALRAGRDEPVGCFTRQFTRSDVRLQVGTAGGLDPTVAAVIVFSDARQVLHQRLRSDLMYLRRPRLYGLLDAQCGLGRRERLAIEACLGPVIGGIGGAESGAAAVRAVFADWTGAERPDEETGLGWKRASIWHNPDRNGAIAQLATVLAGGDAEALWPFGLFLDDEPNVRIPDKVRVVVLVESPEHACVLAGLLPGWAVLCAGGAALGDRRRTAAAGEDRDGPPKSAIMTWLYAHGRGRIEADVVIRADGTPWPLDLPIASPGRGKAGGRPVLLVDLADHQDRTARDAARARRLDYLDRGWCA
jgi:hypothetical protein